MGGDNTFVEYAKQAVEKHPNSDVEVAMTFLQNVLPDFLKESNERLMKVGRQISSLLSMAQEKDSTSFMEQSLERLVEECRLIISGMVRVPRVRFGRTNLLMPIVTLGCMRFQQQWGYNITNMNQVDSDCQDNLKAILKRAVVDYGINHIETARGYGSSELQLGVALQQLYATHNVKREDLIIQTKIPADVDPQVFRQRLETSFRNLQVDYVDLFGFHGANYPEVYDYMFGNNGDNCMAVVKEYVALGKIRHVGFSTHGDAELIRKLIETNEFDYINVHYHYFGSYIISGCGPEGKGNWDNIRLAKERDMGIFIISAMDKGGQLYMPSRKLRSLTLPDMEPATFGCSWLWNHHRLRGEDSSPDVHTLTMGAGRESDLDQAAVAAYLHMTKPEESFAAVKLVSERLDKTFVATLGEDWAKTWYMGLPKHTGSKHLVEHNQIVWLFNVIKAFGLHGFSKKRYGAFEGNKKKWDDSMSNDENIDKNIGRRPWGFVPGLPLEPGVNYLEDDLQNVPEQNKKLVQMAEEFVYEWCSANSGNKKDIPPEWEAAYDMRTNKDFPDRKIDPR